MEKAKRLTALVALLMGVTLVPALAASAQTNPSSVQTSQAQATPAAAPAIQISTNEGGSSVCMNRQGGGGSEGTLVIAYNCGDPNNDFNFLAYTTMCGGGHVTSTCPFADHLQDQVLQGYVIVALEGHVAYCVGNPNPSGGGSVLTGCGNTDGSGAGWGTIDVLVGVKDLSQYGGTPVNVVNRRWTDIWGGERYVCAVSYKGQYTLAGTSAGSGKCQLKEV